MNKARLLLKPRFVYNVNSNNGFLSAQYGRDSVFDSVSDYRSMMPQFTSEGIDKNQELLSLLQAIAAEKQAAPAQISLTWILCKKPYIVPLPGNKKIGTTD